MQVLGYRDGSSFQSGRYMGRSAKPTVWRGTLPEQGLGFSRLGSRWLIFGVEVY